MTALMDSGWYTSMSASKDPHRFNIECSTEEKTSPPRRISSSTVCKWSSLVYTLAGEWGAGGHLLACLGLRTKALH